MPYLNRRISRVVFILLLLHLCVIAIAQESFEQQYRAIIQLLPDEAVKADSLAQQLIVQVNSAVPEVDSLQARSYYLLGLVEYYRSRYVLAEAHFKKALDTEYARRNLLIQDACLNNLGIIYDRKDRVVEALDAYTRSLRLAEQRGDSLSIVQSWINLSQLEHKKANRTREFELCRMALEYSIRHNDSLNMVLAHQNMGFYYRTVDDVENMKFHYGESIRLTLLLENYTQLAHLLVNAAEGYGDTGDYASASKFLSQARELCDKYDISYLKPTIFLNLGCNLRDLGKNYPESEMYFRAAEKLALELDRKEILGGLYRDWADLYAKSGDYKGYRMVTGKYARHLEEQSGADSRSEYEQIQVLYNLDKITAQKTQLELEVRRRNEMLAVSALILLILGVSVTVISVQYVRLRRYVRTLYRMNVSETRQGIAAESSVPNSFSPESQASYERYQAILKLLTEDKLYLDPQLSLQRLATKLATNQKYLSQAINENSGSNFYGLLKQLRINEARRLILEMGTRTNLQVIAEETGFANRYTFTRQFKEVTGFSPSEFVRLAGTQSGETLNDALTEPEQL